MVVKVLKCLLRKHFTASASLSLTCQTLDSSNSEDKVIWLNQNSFFASLGTALVASKFRSLYHYWVHITIRLPLQRKHYKIKRTNELSIWCAHALYVLYIFDVFWTTLMWDQVALSVALLSCLLKILRNKMLLFNRLVPDYHLWGTWPDNGYSSNQSLEFKNSFHCQTQYCISLSLTGGRRWRRL